MCGTRVDRYESPRTIPDEELHWSCPLLQSSGVNHMKFAGLAVFSAERNSGSLEDVVVRKCEHLAAVFMSEKVYEREVIAASWRTEATSSRVTRILSERLPCQPRGFYSVDEV